MLGEEETSKESMHREIWESVACARVVADAERMKMERPGGRTSKPFRSHRNSDTTERVSRLCFWHLCGVVPISKPVVGQVKLILQARAR